MPKKIKKEGVTLATLQAACTRLKEPGITIPIKAVGDEPTDVTLEGESVFYPAVGDMVEKLQKIADEYGWQITNVSIKFIGE